MARLPSTVKARASLCCTVGSMSDRADGGERLRVTANLVPRSTETDWKVLDLGLMSPFQVGLGAW